MSTNDNAAKKDGNSTFLNSLLNSQKPPQSKKEKTSNKLTNECNAARSIKSFFLTPSTSSQNESLSSVSSFGSTVVDMTEIGQLVSNLEFDIISDVTQCVEESDKILKCQNALICRYNEDSNVLMENSRSINNLTKGIGNLVDSQNELKDRVQSLEITKDCALDSHLLNIILVDQTKDVIDAKLITARKFISGNRKLIKILKIRFGDPVSPSRIFAQIVKHNNELSKAGQQANVKYYVETRGSERGILVSYKIKDPQDENKIAFRSSVVTSEKEVDELRVSLKVDDAYIPSGGGVMLYVRRGLAINVISKTSNSHVEAVFVEILSLNLKQKVLVTYRPPSGDLVTFYDFVEEICSCHDDVIIMGDMNINTHNRDKCKHYIDLLLMQNYEIVNNGITRPVSGTLIDHILQKEEFKQTKVSKLNHEKIKNILASTNIDGIVDTCPDVNSAFSELIMSIQSVIKQAQLT